MYEPPAVEVLVVAVECGFGGSGGGGTNADATLPPWGSEDGYWQ